MQEQIARLLSLQPDKKIQNYAFSMNAVIGRGSYGVVYVGRQLDTGLAVALKVVPTQQVQAETLTLIQKEIDIMKDLDSQNVVKLIDVLRTGNNYYIVGELCTGGDLKEYMKRTGAMAEQDALAILVQILRGILQSFKRGIIHRDLKPANILLTHDSAQKLQFKIADFGFAKRFHHLENDLMTSLVGTPLYMSPQVLLRRQYTAKCDIWSIGLIYFELLEGRTPWNVRDILDLVGKQKQNSIQFSRRISKKSQQFILGCLAYEEQNRFTWEQVFTHSIFEGVFEKQQSPSRSAPPTKSVQQVRAEQVQSPKMPEAVRNTQKRQAHKRSVSPSNQIIAPVKVKTLSNCKSFVRAATTTQPTAEASEPAEQKNTPSEMGEGSKRYFKTMNYQTQTNTQPNTYKKDRTISVITKVHTQDFTKTQSELKPLKAVVQKHTMTYEQLASKKCSHQISTKEMTQILDQPSTETSASSSRQYTYQHNLILNYLSEEFSFNRTTIQNHLDYLLFLRTLKSSLADLFGKSNPSSIILKLGFLLSKHAMIKSNEIKVTLIDRGTNIFDLKEFKKFQASEHYQQLEKQVVETHFEIFNQFQENFLQINEQLSLVMNDSEFLEIFTNNFDSTLHFARYAYQLAFNFIKDHIADQIYSPSNNRCLVFVHAILLYADHMKNFQFSTSDVSSVLQALHAHNPGFLSRNEQTNDSSLRYEILGLFNKINCYYERNP